MKMTPKQQTLAKLSIATASALALVTAAIAAQVQSRPAASVAELQQTPAPQPVESSLKVDSEVDLVAASQLPFETLIRPGQSVGPVTPDTTRADLAAAFGEAQLEDMAVHIGEGFTESGTRVNLGETQSFSVIWNPETGKAAEARDFGTAWRTPEGVGMGTSLKELEAIAGPLELYGFGWDYGGTVILGKDIAMSHEGLLLRVQPRSEDINFAQKDDPKTLAYKAVLGDAVFSSQHKSFDQVDAFVYDMVVQLNQP